MSAAFYNENDAYAAQWIRNLIAARHIAPGVVDERSIVDIKPDDLAGYRQFHAFGGIAGWSLALRLAGIPDDADIWTGSCPCQPLSAAGRKRGFADERHLWPVWFELIRACRPQLVMGEQVASRLGFEWLDLVCDDLEGAGYTVRAADTCAASVGAPHIRQRLYFVAYADGLDWRLPARCEGREVSQAVGGGEAYGLGDASGTRAGRHTGAASRAEATFARARGIDRQLDNEPDTSGAAHDRWSTCEWLPCTDGKSRPTQPGLRVLVDGVSPGMGSRRTLRAPRLKGYGNAIVPQQAAAFIRAALEVTP